MADEPMTDEQLDVLTHEIAIPLQASPAGPVAQLAQRNAWASLSYLMKRYQDLRAENDTMRSILADVAKAEPYYSEQPEGWWCTMCDGWQSEAWSPHSDGGKSLFQHDNDCPVMKARAFLADESETNE